MSNADPGWLPPAGPPGPAWWPPPTPPIQQPRPVAYVFAIVLPLILIAVVAAPLGVIWARRPAAGLARPGVPNTSATEGGPGLGDPYYPQAGNSGYDVAKYQIVLDWDPGTATLRGTTTITATATQRLDSFYLDLAVPTEAIKVNGKPATFAKEGFADVRVQPADPVTIGSDFQVVVDYAGQPGEIRQGEVRAWSTTNAEWTVADEPESSAWWFPANDHPVRPGADGHLDPGSRRHGGDQRRPARVGRHRHRAGLRHLALDLPAADGHLPELPHHRAVRDPAGHRGRAALSCTR